MEILIKAFIIMILILFGAFFFIGLHDYYKARDEYRRKTGKYYYDGSDMDN